MQKSIYMCDVCKKEIMNNERMIDASTYGIHFHPTCFMDLTPLALCRYLNLDDITIYGVGSNDPFEKTAVIYNKQFDAEMIQWKKARTSES